jgi:hypothetical protein
MNRNALVALLALAVPAVANLGCSDAQTKVIPPDPCENMITECVAKQQACVSDGTTAHCEACASGQYAAATGSCKAIAGTALPHDFATFTTKPGEEVVGLCQSWTLNNAEEIWVNAVELDQDEASHHSNWTFVPDDKFDGPDGVWNCADRSYDQLSGALAGGVLYAQSTQASHEVQKFPDGAAVRIPPYSRVIGDVHLLNTTQSTITGKVSLTLYSLPKADVKVKLVPFHLSYDGLDIPPHATSRFTGNCSLADKFPNGKLDMRVYYILPHTHSLATRFFVDVLGGPDDKKSLIEVDGFTKEAHGRAYDPPVDLSPATGLSFGCQYFNPRADAVKWGVGDQEMCELLGFAESTTAFESRVPDATTDGTDGDVQLFTGSCGTIAFAWDFNKPGGPGPK